MWRAAPPIAIFDGWEPPTSMSEQSGPFQSRNSRLNPNARWRHTVTGPPEYNSPHLSKTAIGRAAILLNGHSSQTYTGALRYNPGVPRRLHRYYGAGYLHFITTSCYQRKPLLSSPRARDLFLEVLEEVRRRFRFVVVGYVVMPEHVHLLI